MQFTTHSFNDDSRFSAFAKYNRGKYNEEDRRNDVYSTDVNSDERKYWEFEKSNRNQYTLTIDYDGAEHDYGNISGGNNFVHTNDANYDQTVNPHDKAHVNLVSNYSYASYSKMCKRLFVMGSIGLQYMHIQTNDGSKSWWRPRNHRLSV